MTAILSPQEEMLKRFCAYCFRAVRNASSDAYTFLKKNMEHHISFSSLSGKLPEPSREDPVGITFHVCGQQITIYHAALAEALERIPAESRNIILRYYIFRQTETEIALCLHMQRRTVCNKKNKALATLKRWMEDMV